MTFKPKVLILILALFSSSCETLSSQDVSGINLTQLLKRPDVVTVTYIQNRNGLFAVPVEVDEITHLFMIDTGATKSAIFNDQLDSFEHSESEYKFANVFGMIETGQRPIVKIKNLRIGARDLSGLDVAVLPERELIGDDVRDVALAGLIGMDVLKGFNFYVSAETQTISFIPVKYPAPKLTETWKRVPLYHNPNAIIDKSLHFFDIRVGNHLLPAILDTGAEFNVVNWAATEIPEINRLKKKLRQEWRVQGAVGDFDPAIRVKVNGLKAGSKEWGVNEFIVMNFSHMNTLGFDDKPLVIAGANLMGNNGFYISFDQNLLLLAPDTLDELSIEP